MKINLFCFNLFLISVLVFGGCEKKHKDETGTSPAVQVVHMKKELQESVGISVVETIKQKLQSSIEAYGSIAQDTESTTHIVSKESGILKSFKKTVGDTVDEGVSVAMVQTFKGQQLEILSPLHGIVIAQYVKEGERVDSITSIATIANPDLLRASFDIYEKDLGFISLDQKVIVTSISYPRKEFLGKVVFISPRVDETSRTIKIRVDVENDEHLLKFGMAVTGKIIKQSEKKSILIPVESLQTLEDAFVVFVKKEEGVFEVRKVEKGQETETQIEIVDGLAEGEVIAEHGTFTLKSELLKDELGEED